MDESLGQFQYRGNVDSTGGRDASVVGGVVTFSRDWLEAHIEAESDRWLAVD